MNFLGATIQQPQQKIIINVLLFEKSVIPLHTRKPILFSLECTKSVHFKSFFKN